MDLWTNAVGSHDAGSTNCGDFGVKVWLDPAATSPVPVAWFSIDNTAKSVTYPTNMSTANVGTLTTYYTVYLLDYPSQETASVSTSSQTLTIVDPCGSPTLTDPGQTDPATYEYTGTTSTFTLAAFTANPA